MKRPTNRRFICIWCSRDCRLRPIQGCIVVKRTPPASEYAQNTCTVETLGALKTKTAIHRIAVKLCVNWHESCLRRPNLCWHTLSGQFPYILASLPYRNSYSRSSWYLVVLPCAVQNTHSHHLDAVKNLLMHCCFPCLFSVFSMVTKCNGFKSTPIFQNGNTAV